MPVWYKSGDHLTRLERRGPVEPAAPEPIPCHEVLGIICDWIEEGLWASPETGCDGCTAWLVRECNTGRLRLLVNRTWLPAPGYSASGTDEMLLDLPEWAGERFPIEGVGA